MIATKHDQPYSSTMSWLRCTLSFSLLRSEHTAWLVMRSFHTTRKGVRLKVATHDKHTVSYPT